MKYVLDTNIVLYQLAGRLAEPLPTGGFLISIITEIELLSYPGLNDAETRIRALLADVSIVELSPAIAQQTITLRRQHRLKIPDAVIAATALVHEAELLTNDARFKSVAKLPNRVLALQV